MATVGTVLFRITIGHGCGYVWQAPPGQEIIERSEYHDHRALFRIEVDPNPNGIRLEVCRRPDGSLELSSSPEIRYYFKDKSGVYCVSGDDGEGYKIVEDAPQPLMKPEFSLEEIEQAQEVLDNLSH